VHTRSRREAFGAAAPPDESASFSFERVLREASQEHVYATCAADAVAAALGGYNAAVMAYGQTGAGKTFTMTGSRDSYASRGVAPRAVSALFAALASRPDGGAGAVVRVSYAELYNEAWGDLLAPSTPAAALSVQEDGAGGVMLRGLCGRIATCEADALAALFEGDHNRSVGEHALNRASSRSHAIFTLSLEIRAGGPVGAAAAEDAVHGIAAGRVVVSKLHFVDLAGSERLLKTRSEGLVASEAKHINKSLSFLEQTVLALSEGYGHIPYRSSKLTHFLKDTLGGNCKTILIAAVWGAREQLDETLSTCRFGARMACIHNAAAVNVREDAPTLIARLRREVASLKAELAAATEAGADGGVSAAYKPFDDDLRAALRADVARYFDAPPPPACRAGEEEAEEEAALDAAGLGLRSLRHGREALRAARDIFREVLAGASAGASARGSGGSSAAAGGRGRGRGSAGNDMASVRGDAENDDDDADADDAAADAAADELADGAAAGTDSYAFDADRPPQPRTPPPPAPPSPPPAPPPKPDRDAAFVEYKAGAGAEAASLLAENKAALRARRGELKELAARINAAKHGARA
jgi:kinesin family protein 6/9